jgi:hypothetical protein
MSCHTPALKGHASSFRRIALPGRGGAQTPAKQAERSDAERARRIRETAREIDASNDPKEFGRAFENLAKSTARKLPESRK